MYVGLALFRIAELIYGKLNEPPSAFVKLIDAILKILPDAEVKAESIEKIEESKSRSRILLLHPNHEIALFPLVFGKVDFPECRRAF